MADDKKPRHKLNADELIEETHVSIRKIIDLLDSNGLAAESVEHLTSLDNKLDFMVSGYSFDPVLTQSGSRT